MLVPWRIGALAVRKQSTACLPAQVALAACRQNGLALEFLPAMQATKSVVHAAFDQNRAALAFAAPKLRANRIFVFEIMLKT